jgi:hypothetical protein
VRHVWQLIVHEVGQVLGGDWRAVVPEAAAAAAAVHHDHAAGDRQQFLPRLVRVAAHRHVRRRIAAALRPLSDGHRHRPACPGRPLELMPRVHPQAPARQPFQHDAVELLAQEEQIRARAVVLDAAVRVDNGLPQPGPFLPRGAAGHGGVQRIERTPIRAGELSVPVDRCAVILAGAVDRVVPVQGGAVLG